MLKTKRARGLFALGVALALHTGFYAAIANDPLNGVMFGLGVPVVMAAIGYAGYRVAQWIDEAR